MSNSEGTYVTNTVLCTINIAFLNKFDGDCFALVGAHQHGITIHNQDLMRERESGVISFITLLWAGGGGVEKY